MGCEWKDMWEQGLPLAWTVGLIRRTITKLYNCYTIFRKNIGRVKSRMVVFKLIKLMGHARFVLLAPTFLLRITCEIQNTTNTRAPEKL